MADDVFGDEGLFAEFERERAPCDAILLNERQGLGRENDERTSPRNIGDPSSAESEDGSDWGDTDADRPGEDNEISSRKEIGENETTIKKDNVAQKLFKAAQDDGAEKIAKLQQENDRLSANSKLVESSRCVIDEDGPLLKILFMNNRIARKYKADIETFVQQLIEKDQQDNDRLAVLNLKPPTVRQVDDSHYTPMARDRWNRIQYAHTVIGCEHFFRDFAYDAMGWPLVEATPALTDGWELPTYEQAFTTSLPVDSDDEDACPQPNKQRMKACCFNCGGTDHKLTECPQPKNQAKINATRKEFQNSKQGQMKNTRYHADEDLDPRFSKFQPGVVSDELREALGIPSDQMIPYIYQMRLLGYPPGHLEDAKLETSGICVFDKHGKEVSKDGDLLEDGEVNLQPRVQYDVSKIHEYPGFNVPLPPGIRDDSDTLGMPAMHPQHQKSVMEYMLTNGQGGAGVKRSNSEGDKPRKRQKKEEKPTEDMDLASGSDGETSGDSKRPSFSIGDSEPGSRRSTPPGTPTLEMLEDQQAALLKQIEAEGLDAENLQIESCECTDTEGNSTDTSASVAKKPQNLNESMDDNSSPSQPIPSTPRALHNTSASISRDFGTPIPESIAKVEKLPAPSKFADGIQQDIPFQNLPNSTGTFKKLLDTLKKVRSQNEGK